MDDLDLELVKNRFPDSLKSPVLIFNVPVLPFTLCTGEPGVNISIQSVTNPP